MKLMQSIGADIMFFFGIVGLSGYIQMEVAMVWMTIGGIIFIGGADK